MADCFSFSIQMFSNVCTFSQSPLQSVQPRKRVSSIAKFSSSDLHLGHSPPICSSTSSCDADAPQCPQNFDPTNISPRHFEQPTVFRRVLQKSHRDLSLATP